MRPFQRALITATMVFLSGCQQIAHPPEQPQFDPPALDVDVKKMDQHFIITLTMNWDDGIGRAFPSEDSYVAHDNVVYRLGGNDLHYPGDSRPLTESECEHLSRPMLEDPASPCVSFWVTPEPHGVVMSGLGISEVRVRIEGTGTWLERGRDGVSASDPGGTPADGCMTVTWED